MALLVDLFGYLGIVAHGLTIVAQSLAVGSVLFVVFASRPLAWIVGAPGAAMVQSGARIGAWSALGVVGAEALALGLQTAVLVATVDLPVADVLATQFALAGMVKIAAAFLLAAVLLGAGGRAPGWLLLPLIAIELGAATLGAHAAARLDDRLPLLAASALHQFGAAIWIGGIPAFLAALARLEEPAAWHIVGTRFSRLCMVGVAAIALSGGVLAWFTIGDPAALYGTAYGVMVAAKIALFAALLLLGWGNNRLIGRLGRNRQTPITRLRRFAEVQIGIGMTIFFASASLSALPPAVDVTPDRVTWQVIARNAADIAWSDYSHHWTAILVAAIGLLALLNRAGLRVARHWPAILIGLGAFVFIRSDAELWPLGSVPLLDGLRDAAVLRPHVCAVLIAAVGLFEWWVQATGRRTGWTPLVFPLACAIGATALLTHTPAIANIRDQLLIALTQTPIALLGVVVAWGRWLELRLDPPGNRVAGWVWPLALLVAGLGLLNYREA